MENNFDSMLNVSAVPQDDKKAAFYCEEPKIIGTVAMSCPSRSRMKWRQTAGNFSSIWTYRPRFDRYTANNALLILAQRPDAERLGDYGYWREQGVFVKRAERQNPVLIMEPGKEYEREDGSIGTLL